MQEIMICPIQSHAVMGIIKLLVVLYLVVYSYANLNIVGKEAVRSKSLAARGQAELQRGGNWQNWHDKNLKQSKALAMEFVKDAEVLKDLLNFMQKRVDFFDKPMRKKFIRLEKEAIKLMQNIEEMDVN